jgi:hypothetical protein
VGGALLKRCEKYEKRGSDVIAEKITSSARVGAFREGVATRTVGEWTRKKQMAQRPLSALAAAKIELSTPTGKR